jgi:hypothetical protein
VSFNKTQTDPNLLLRTALDTGVKILGFQENVRHLNQAFMDLTEPGVPPIAETPNRIPPPPMLESGGAA